MPSPFPGMDPYLESQSAWPDFHARFITYCADELGGALPGHYVAQIDERIRLIDLEEGTSRTIRPDVAILRGERWDQMAGAVPVGVAMLGPVAVTLARDDPEGVRETAIEILRLPDRELVTVIEVLSPSNKFTPGREEYLAKRWTLLDGPTHLVEIDLLLRGDRLPMRGPVPPGDYLALVSRSERRPIADAYAWSIRRPLPTIPIPLHAPDPDVPLDLAAVFATAYDRGRYDRLLDYRAPLPAPLADADRAWAEARARPAGP